VTVDQTRGVGGADADDGGQDGEEGQKSLHRVCGVEG
jgi:hypothetical protein